MSEEFFAHEEPAMTDATPLEAAHVPALPPAPAEPTTPTPAPDTGPPAPAPRQARAVGWLDLEGGGGAQRRGSPVVARWNAVQGREEHLLLQVPGPFGGPFRLPVRLGSLLAGRDLLRQARPGATLAVTGELEWVVTTDGRYATPEHPRGRRQREVVFRATQIAPAAGDDAPGCDVWLHGVVLAAPRVYPHPDRPVLLAVTTLRIEVAHGRPGSRARLTEPANVPVAIPLEHPDASVLLRPNNVVRVEGLLERVVLPISDAAVQAALAQLDADWMRQQRNGKGQGPSPEAQRRYARQRRQLQQTAQLRVLAGWAELVSGAPATPAEARTLRQTALARRWGRAQRGEEELRVGELPPITVPPADPGPPRDDAGEERAEEV